MALTQAQVAFITGITKPEALSSRELQALRLWRRQSTEMGDQLLLDRVLALAPERSAEAQLERDRERLAYLDRRADGPMRQHNAHAARREEQRAIEWAEQRKAREDSDRQRREYLRKLNDGTPQEKYEAQRLGFRPQPPVLSAQERSEIEREVRSTLADREKAFSDERRDLRRRTRA